MKFTVFHEKRFSNEARSLTLANNAFPVEHHLARIKHLVRVGVSEKGCDKETSHRSRQQQRLFGVVRENFALESEFFFFIRAVLTTAENKVKSDKEFLA